MNYYVADLFGMYTKPAKPEKPLFAVQSDLF